VGAACGGNGSTASRASRPSSRCSSAAHRVGWPSPRCRTFSGLADVGAANSREALAVSEMSDCRSRTSPCSVGEHGPRAGASLLASVVELCPACAGRALQALSCGPVRETVAICSSVGLELRLVAPRSTCPWQGVVPSGGGVQAAGGSGRAGWPGHRSRARYRLWGVGSRWLRQPRAPDDGSTRTISAAFQDAC
jgi:hypothetical protein